MAFSPKICVPSSPLPYALRFFAFSPVALCSYAAKGATTTTITAAATATHHKCRLNTLTHSDSECKWTSRGKLPSERQQQQQQPQHQLWSLLSAHSLNTIFNLPPSLSFSRSLSRSTSLNTPINCLVIAQCCAVAVAVCCCYCCYCAWPEVQVEVCSKKKLNRRCRRRQRSLLIQAERVASVDWALDPTMTLLALSLFATLTLFVVCIGFSAAALQIYRLLSLIASLGPATTTTRTTPITTTTTCDTHASLIYEACARTLAHCQMLDRERDRERQRNALSSLQLTQRRSSDRGRRCDRGKGSTHTGCPLFTLIDACDFLSVRFVYAHLFTAGMAK